MTMEESFDWKKELPKFIVSIDKRELIYLSEDGIQKHISFADCSKNYAKKYVASRYDDFFEFYTEPPVKFELKNRKEYLAVLLGIIEAGWFTFDQM